MEVTSQEVVVDHESAVAQNEVKAEKTFTREQLNEYIRKEKEKERQRVLAEVKSKALEETVETSGLAEKVKEVDIKKQLQILQSQVKQMEREKQVSKIEAELAKKGLPSELARYAPVEEEAAASYIVALDEFAKSKDELIKNNNLRGVPPKLGIRIEPGKAGVAPGMAALYNQLTNNKI